ncbi:DUF1761 domain-containing protein [Sphingosinicella sp. LHD-64]|uniref:DUF1761 domain-containing protein n=1 Tax=Sphingosinicella sp. LHD-64 TaxID=3072139 RepID=UPI00280E0FDE|nr:DUF1761 domain-containing protein [Sphingosinicella sp. LHD-64]MDQ8758055.1 DUF1761 domain-containing protein [Sphingosinicella sp. LHD-64]
MPEVNYIAVLLAALSAFVLGGLWYSPVLFGNKWAALTGQSEEVLKSGSMPVIFGGAFLLNLIAAFVLAMFLGPMPPSHATLAGLSVGLCWVAASLGVNYLFERRPLGLWLINSGYFVLQFTAMGAIIGAFN